MNRLCACACPGRPRPPPIPRLVHGPLVVILVTLALLTSHASAAALRLSQDRRAIIPVLEFGFAPGGSLNLSCPNEWGLPANITTSVDLRGVGSATNYVHRITQNESAIWHRAKTGPAISATLEYKAVNPPNSLLDVGLQPLPRIFFLAAAFYVLLMAKFVKMMREPEAQVFWIHRMMLLLLVLLVVDKTFHSVQTWYLDNGVDAKGWDLAAYILTFIKSSVAMTIVALIASGWSFVRPILPKRERRIVLCIIPLQLVTNFARFMIEVLAFGSQSWTTWTSIFPLFDLASFLMILWIILSTRAHLLQAAEDDGKAQQTLDKIKLWGTLYGIVLGYLYLTRIIAVVLQAVLPFTHLWVADAFLEGVSAWFYAIMGWKFRPVAANPYTQVGAGGMWADDEDDDEDDEQSRAEGGVVRRKPAAGGEGEVGEDGMPGTALEMEEVVTFTIDEEDDDEHHVVAPAAAEASSSTEPSRSA
ncbi:lung seven transmembrane receptor-domain-containing protein [Catenaria anguillulae PL171]|uniref:Lung seven transmembrane receptor-domain-containing protein n=1 Tax=Catenaria anguillulae PL171 TaxID=765915 RepID=A0A1Y2HSX4_9FUNG|nr:lung seven transmembrane receptor-domain-containing protein [Catenaria anguillulae PL171]